MAFVVRDTSTGAMRSRGAYPTGQAAMASAKRMVRRVSAPVDVWWMNDAGIPKVRMGAVMILDGSVHVNLTVEGVAARGRGEI